MSDRDSFHSGEDGSDSGSESDGSDADSDDMDLDADDIPVTGFAVASNRRNQEFHEMFPSIPDGDYLIEDYGCALQREILIQGRIYISENHVCFHANLFGWVTDLTIPMYDVLGLEKRMTAFVIPNAIQITTRNAKYTFTSFLSRDTTYDVLYNVWRLARPENESMIGSTSQLSVVGAAEQAVSENGTPTPGGAAAAVANGKTPANGAAKPAAIANKITQCACGKAGQHFSEVAMDVVIPGTPEKIYNLMFTSGFIKDFMRDNQRLIDIQISDWMPLPNNGQLLARNMSYIKPLSGSIGPKQTKCELRDETMHCNFDDYVTMMTTTRTPDVPSGGVFSVKTRTCITWASSISTRILVTTMVEWTGRSFIKGIIEKSCIDGQKSYQNELEKGMREYIHQHQSEFVPEGTTATIEEVEAAVCADVPKTPTQEKHLLSAEDDAKARERERNRRSLQWAYDTFEGAFKVAKQSTEGAIDLIVDAWDQSSSTTILYFIIVFLVLSNIWTLTMMGSREEAGRRKEAKKVEEKEKWVQGVVTAIWDELNGAVRPMPPPSSAPALGESIVRAGAVGLDWKEEVREMSKLLDAVDERVQRIRQSLKDLD